MGVHHSAADIGASGRTRSELREVYRSRTGEE